MNVSTQKSHLDESKLALLLVRRKVITDGQLKAAMDYQRSLGGKITDVLVKLDLVRQAQIDEIARNPDGPESQPEAGTADLALDPGCIQVSDLKVHRRLLDKLPLDLADRYLIVLFFPVPSGDSRKIVMGHGREITPDVAEKVRSILGVDLYTLSLDPKVAKDLLQGEQHQGSQRKVLAPAPHPETPASRPGGIPVDALANAIMSALLKKGILTREEIEAELPVDSRTRSRVVPLKT